MCIRISILQTRIMGDILNPDPGSIKAEIKVPKSVEKRSGIQHIDKVIER